MAVAIFDLDGTLIDAVEDIASCINPHLQARGATPLTNTEAGALLGEGLRSFGHRAFQLRQLPAPETEIDAFIAEYIAAPVVHTRLYPQVPEALRALRAAGWRLTVCTNKAEAAANRILAQLCVLEWFEVVCGGDAAPWRKPDPRHLELTLDRAGLRGHPAIMIGDNRVDVAAARGMGIPCVFAAWGYGSKDMAEGATAVAQRFADLPGVLHAALQPAPGLAQAPRSQSSPER